MDVLLRIVLPFGVHIFIPYEHDVLQHAKPDLQSKSLLHGYESNNRIHFKSSTFGHVPKTFKKTYQIMNNPSRVTDKFRTPFIFSGETFH